jgi:(1->4)-alpha-D-glucan 1-alpha-D-glucosylmutase
LSVAGSLKSHVVTFARELPDKRIIAIAPRFLTSLVKEGEYPLGEQVWHETRIVPPPGSSDVWYDAITGQKVQGEDTLWLREILQQFPVALLVNQAEAALQETEGNK